MKKQIKRKISSKEKREKVKITKTLRYKSSLPKGTFYGIPNYIIELRVPIHNKRLNLLQKKVLSTYRKYEAFSNIFSIATLRVLNKLKKELENEQ